MARLNEPPAAPAPALSNGDLDAIKRKFLRTNRELAKINSQQQVHIRQLENDRSRLVAENCSLAQQVLHLQNTIETQPHAPSFSTIDILKNQLEIKIQELGGLVAGLGQLKQRGSSAPCNVKTATKKTPDERQWRSALGLQEVENAMLPTITEHKAYPRMTMNAEELQDILAPDSQSPDIGPPPVSHFDIEEPIAFKHSPSADEQCDMACDGEEVVLPMNIEPRRKRRESGPRMRRMSLFESPREEPEEKHQEDSQEVPEKTVRTGAKRKFSVQEDDNQSQPQAEPFHFSRRGTPVSTEEENTDGERPLARTRPILSSKPVNTDPMVSPKKQRSSAPEKPEKKKPARTRVTVSRHLRPDVIPQETPEPIATAEIHLESLPPKTPAAEPSYSPPSTEPSTSRAESKDTPPPGDLSSMSQIGIVGRPSRRARPQVSYKEPSLATKMRRPSKELVDAVVDRRTSVEPPKSAPSSAHVMFKEEPEDSPWKPHGAVAEMRGGDGVEMGSPLRQKLDRNEGSQDAKSERPKLNSVAAERAIEKMIEETSTAKRKSFTSSGVLSAKEAADEPTSQEKKESKPRAMTAGPDSDMAIFDFTDSSPAAGAPTRKDAGPKISLASAARERRRHSLVPASAPECEDRKTEPGARVNGGLPTIHKRTGSGAMKTSAPAAGLAKSTAAARSSQKEERKAGTLPSSRSNSRLGSREDGLRDGRSERATGRRASMIV